MDLLVERKCLAARQIYNEVPKLLYDESKA